MITRGLVVLLGLFATGVAAAQPVAPCPTSDRSEQYFPPGSAPERASSGWRIAWQLWPATPPNGPAAKWVIAGAEFMTRGHDGAPRWLKVLDHLHLSEMYVPYDSGHELFDISANNFSFVPIAEGTSVAAAAPTPPCHHRQIVLEEVRDDDVRWVDDRRASQIGRGHELVLWATLDGGNYRYVVRYGFADDGSIRARVGATASNLHHRRRDRDPRAEVVAEDDIHVHMAGWRLEMHLGDPAANRVTLLERRACSDPGAACGTERGAVLERRTFLNEGSAVWRPERFGMIVIENGAGERRPGYTMVPRSAGVVRSARPFSQSDFWVSRRDPQALLAGCARRIPPEWVFIDLPTWQSCPQTLVGHAAVLWHQSAAYHWPRGEDFGAGSDHRDLGVATTAWSGFDLIPRDILPGTPLLRR